MTQSYCILHYLFVKLCLINLYKICAQGHTEMPEFAPLLKPYLLRSNSVLPKGGNNSEQLTKIAI